MSSNQHIFDYDPKITIPMIGTVFFSITYITGYLISAMFLRHRGISPLPLLKAQYVETGFSFFLLTIILIGIPYLINHMAISHEKERGARFKSSIVSAVVTNYLLVILLVVIFIEKEWTESAEIFSMNIKFPLIIVPYLLLTIIFLTIPRIKGGIDIETPKCRRVPQNYSRSCGSGCTSSKPAFSLAKFPDSSPTISRSACNLSSRLLCALISSASTLA